MTRSSLRPLGPLAGVACVVTLALAAAGLAPGATRGQSNPSATPAATATMSAGSAASASSTAPAAAAAPQAAPGIDNETAVRTLLPAQFANANPLPGKWSRADMPFAPGGYVVFIATVYPMADDQGNTAWWLLANYLQWNGTQWVKGLDTYQGRKLSGDDAWLAQNLTDITALASPPEQTWNVFTVGYSADGIVSPTLARTETLVEIYDLTLTTVWSRVDSLQEIDTSNASYVKTTNANVDWVFRDIDGDGIAELIATVTTQTTITLTSAPDPTLPASGTTTATTTETYKWIDGVYVLLRQPPPSATPAATPAAAAPTRTPTAAPTATPSPSATPRPTGTPAG